jgi:hypothetical protein
MAEKRQKHWFNRRPSSDYRTYQSHLQSFENQQERFFFPACLMIMVGQRVHCLLYLSAKHDLTGYRAFN